AVAQVGRLSQRGQVIAGKPPKRVRGKGNRCHHNVAFRYLDNPFTYEIATGYGLTAADGLWRQHSWLWDGKRVLETTVVRDVYFGVVLDRVAAAGFVFGVVAYLLPELEEFFTGNGCGRARTPGRRGRPQPAGPGADAAEEGRRPRRGRCEPVQELDRAGRTWRKAGEPEGTSLRAEMGVAC